MINTVPPCFAKDYYGFSHKKVGPRPTNLSLICMLRLWRHIHSAITGVSGLTYFFISVFQLVEGISREKIRQVLHQPLAF